MRRKACTGFTLIELLAVVTIVGLLAAVAAVQVSTTLQRSKMSIIKHDLRVMRDLIQQYKVDKKKYPEDLQELVGAGYLRVLPTDPITQSSTTWIQVPNEPDPDSDELEEEDTGIVDVLSGATGTDLDGVPYGEY